LTGYDLELTFFNSAALWCKFYLQYAPRRLSGGSNDLRDLGYPTPYLHFCDYLPLEDDLAIYLNKLEFPSPKDKVYQFGLLALEKKIFKKILSVFFTLLLLSPLGEGQSPSFEQT
jgi:hypothetical protein